MRALLTGLAIFLALGTSSAGCAGGAVDRRFNPWLSSPDTDVVELVVDRALFKPNKHLRVWGWVRNHTDNPLSLGYGYFMARVHGMTYGGALRVPFVRVEASFILGAGETKRFPGPIEFTDVPMTSEAIFALMIPSGQPGGDREISVRIPLRR